MYGRTANPIEKVKTVARVLQDRMSSLLGTDTHNTRNYDHFLQEATKKCGRTYVNWCMVKRNFWTNQSFSTHHQEVLGLTLMTRLRDVMRGGRNPVCVEWCWVCQVHFRVTGMMQKVSTFF